MKHRILKKVSTLSRYFWVINLVLFSLVVFIIALRINVFRYNNFDLGKFDLGNMNQMLWTTMHGQFMYLTDYFGTNLPRWAMSHVDPILLLSLPFFAVFQHPLTIVIVQLITVIFSSLLVYKITYINSQSRAASFFFGAAYLLYPALGFLIAWTGYHGVTAAIPFFFAVFYLFEKMYKEQNFSKKRMLLFWILLVIVMSGKEQLALYTFLFGFFIATMRNMKKLGIQIMVVSMAWFIMAFFIIIPAYSHYRIDGYVKFSQSLGIDGSLTANVIKPNYFLARYAGFGDTYAEVIVNMLLRPHLLVTTFFGGDKVENFRMTLEPLGYLPFAYPLIFIMSGPDFLINYATTEGGIGTAEIYNHRISMLIPILFISSIYGLIYLSGIFSTLFKRPNWRNRILVIGCAFIAVLNLYKSFEYNNPIYLWLSQAVEKRIAFAKTATEVVEANHAIGDIVRLDPLDNKDRECAEKIVHMIPDNVSVSGPDYLGAHLSLRETYAIYPALFNSAEYVIVDVFSQKLLRILEEDVTLVRDVTGDVIKDPNYEMVAGCGNLFVFKKIGPHNKTELLPLQERNSYTEITNYPILQTLTVVDHAMPAEVTRGVKSNVKYVFVKREGDSLNDYILFTTLINKETGEIYQLANLPSFSLMQLKDWTAGKYYEEDIELVIPTYLDTGSYMYFVGMTNNIKTRSVYLGDIEVK